MERAVQEQWTGTAEAPRPFHREHNPPRRGGPFLPLTILVNGLTSQDGAVVLTDPLPWPCRPQRLRYELRSQVWMAEGSATVARL